MDYVQNQQQWQGTAPQGDGSWGAQPKAGLGHQQQQPGGLVNYMLGFPATQPDMLMGGIQQVLPPTGHRPALVAALVGGEQQIPGAADAAHAGPDPYGSSSSILYGTLDGSRSSMPSGPPTGSWRRAMYSGAAYGSGYNSSAGLGAGDASLGRSDYAYLGPMGSAAAGGPQGSAAHSVESLLEVIASLPPQQDCAAVVGVRLQHLDSSALAALMKELGRGSMFKRSVEIFDFLRRQPGPEYTHLLDIYTYTTAIAVCSASQQLRRALDLMAEMRARGITCNVHTYSALMNVCIKCNEVGLVQQVYAQMIQEGCTPNLVTYNTLIDLYVKTGQWQEAIKLLDKLEAEGIQPEVRTYNTIITACNKSGKPEEGLKIYERMVSAGVKPSATTYTALISAYGKQGKVEKAMEIFADMAQRGCECNVITYSSLISACEKAGRCELALQLFERMHKEGCMPNVVTYNSLIAACSHGGHWEKAKECFNQMLAQGCRPDGITFSALITAYQRGHQWREALQAFAHMPASGCHPDSVVYNALLEVAWASGVLAMQMRANQIWSLANRSGHFRIYNQSKGDPSVHQHSCVVFTSGAAIVTLLRWLCDVRYKVGTDGSALLRERVLFCLQKGKASRIEQPSALICEAVTTLLAGHGSPFTVTLVDSTTQLEAPSGALVEWLHSPAFGALAFLVNANSVRRLSVEQLVAEDAALDKSCADALSFVRTYEQLRGYNKQIQPNTHDPLGATTRQQLLDLAQHYASCFRFAPEVLYDGWELLQRLLMAGATPPLGASGSQMWRLMLVACLLMAARHNAADLLPLVPSYDVVSLNTGYPADSIVNTEQNVHLVLGSDAAAVSALRVCQVLLERLGGQAQEPRLAAALTEDLAAMAYKVAGSSALFRVAPSLVAQALMYCLRRKRGLVPVWPCALVQLTGIYDPTVGDLGLIMQQLLPLLGLEEGGAAEPAAASGSSTNNAAGGGSSGGAPAAAPAGGQAGGVAQAAAANAAAGGTPAPAGALNATGAGAGAAAAAAAAAAAGQDGPAAPAAEQQSATPASPTPPPPHPTVTVVSGPPASPA